MTTPTPTAACWCEKCRPITLSDMRMVICPDCGDKRCIHAADHAAPCAKIDIYAHNHWIARAALAAPTAEPADAWVPVHPRNGPLWSMTTAQPSAERLPGSYPLMPVYLSAPPSAPTAEPAPTIKVVRGLLARCRNMLSHPAHWGADDSVVASRHHLYLDVVTYLDSATPTQLTNCPSDAMEIAGMRALRNTHRTVTGEYSREQARACWEAMCDAAPTAERPADTLRRMAAADPSVHAEILRQLSPANPTKENDRD